MNEFFADGEDWASFTGKCRECGQGTFRGMPVCKDCYTKNDINENERAHILASIVCDAIWGGELAWAVATNDQFQRLVEKATKRLYRKAKT